MKPIFFGIFALWIGSVVFAAQGAAKAPSVANGRASHGVSTGTPLSASSREVLEVAQRLTVEGEAPEARKALSALPRVKVVRAVREGLRVGGSTALLAAQTANTLRLTEVVPDLEKAAALDPSSGKADDGDWQLMLALGSLEPENRRAWLASVWLTKLAKFDSPSQIAIYEMLGRWGVPLSDAQFDKGVADESFGIRQAVIRQFIATRNKLSSAQQTERYRKAFALKPYQVRLDAMLDYEHLSVKERAQVASAVDAKFAQACQSEGKPEVKTECEKILKGAK